MKFIRYYEIRIKTPTGVLVTIKPPISAQMDIDRSVMSSVNNCSVTLWNLAADTRNTIFKDKYIFDKYWQMSILAGYGESELYEIFRGNIQEAFSYKKNTEWITEIAAYDGSYAIQNSFTSETMSKDTSIETMVKRIIHDMPNTLEGVLGSPVTSAAPPVRGQVLMGPSFGLLQGLIDGQAFIDMETMHILAAGEAVAGNVFVLDGDNIFETPRRREQFLEVPCLFSPEVRVGYLCEIRSADPRYNGQYKVYGVKHSATISSATCGDATSIISLYKGSAPFVEISK